MIKKATIMTEFMPNDWYWKIKSNGKIYHSKRNIYVSEDDPDLIAFRMTEGKGVTNIASTQELKEVLFRYDLPFFKEHMSRVEKALDDPGTKALFEALTLATGMNMEVLKSAAKTLETKQRLRDSLLVK